jgi:hypothetical protein
MIQNAGLPHLVRHNRKTIVGLAALLAASRIAGNQAAFANEHDWFHR